MIHREKTISGFSKLSKRSKIKWIVENFFKDPENVMRELKSYWLDDEEHQKILDEISENTISNYYLPYGVAPNFVINDKPYAVPMVTEESSVVAAAASAAKFWMSRGGFHARVIDTVKLGQVHFFFKGEKSIVTECMPELRDYLEAHSEDLTRSMRERGGGVLDIQIKDFTLEMANYYQLLVSFETCDSMGANFINSVLEKHAQSLSTFFREIKGVPEEQVEVLMAILSNYTPDSLVRVEVTCPIEALGSFKGGLNSDEFAERFCQAIRIAEIDNYRATTHNKGIFNGIDAVVIATGNDFRVIEASGHAFAARDGRYRSLSHCEIKDGIFRFWLEIPLAVGTVGGLTSMHPIARRSFELLGDPPVRELMTIIASTGLAQNFSAIRSLVTTGIQDGHMRMHLGNILVKLEATTEEFDAARKYFDGRPVSTTAVREFLLTHRGTSATPSGKIQTT